MKTYIKPNTELHQIELTQMIADSPTPPPVNNNDANQDSNGDYGDAKVHGLGTTSLWDEEE